MPRLRTSGDGPQNLNEGFVVFVTKCGGKEEFRSDVMEGWGEGQVEIGVSGVMQLDLMVTDTGDGTWANCGVRFSPTLTR